jgi:hypothetical protein
VNFQPTMTLSELDGATVAVKTVPMAFVPDETNRQTDVQHPSLAAPVGL